MSKTKTKRKSKNEFRFNYDTGHMNYIFEEDSKRYHALGITHKSKTYGVKNMPLAKNPQRGKTKKSYLRYGYISNYKYKFANKTDKRFSFSDSDFLNVKSKIRKYKSYRLKRK